MLVNYNALRSAFFLGIVMVSYSDFNTQLSDSFSEYGAAPVTQNPSGPIVSPPGSPAPPDPGGRQGQDTPDVVDALGRASLIRDTVCYLYEIAPNQVAAAVGAFNEGRFVNAYRALLNSFCPQVPNWQPPPELSPYPGGQCECTPYEVTFGFLLNNGTGPLQTGTAVLSGPIYGSYSRDLGDNFSGEGIIVHGACEGGVQVGTTETSVALSSIKNMLTIRIVNVVPQAGFSDDCGSNPPPLLDREPIDLTNFNFTFNTNTFNGPTLVRPSISFNPSGRLDVRLPDLNVSLGPTDIDVGLPGGGSDSGGDDGGSITLPNPDDTEVDPDAPNPAPPDNSRADPDPTDETVRVIVGVMITIDVTNGFQTVISQDGGNPDVFAPDLGLVNFKIKLDDDVFAWTEDIRIKNVRQLVTCPWPYGAVNVKASFRDGIDGELTPIFTKLAEQEVELGN